MTEELLELTSLCKAGVYISVNEHRNIYQSAEEALENLSDDEPCCDGDIWARIVETDTLVDVQVYPDTPIGFYKVIHYDLKTAISRVLAAIKADRGI